MALLQCHPSLQTLQTPDTNRTENIYSLEIYTPRKLTPTEIEIYIPTRSFEIWYGFNLYKSFFKFINVTHVWPYGQYGQSKV